VSLARKRRGTQSNGDGSSSSTKQTFTTAINQILHRRASVSSQRPKDLLAEINTNRLEITNNIKNTSPPSPVAVNAPFKQQPQNQPSQNQPSQNQPSHSTQQQPPLQRLLRKKSLRSPTSGQYSPVSPSQCSPLSPTVEEDLSDSLSDFDSNNNLNNKRMHHATNSSSVNSIASSPSSISSPRKQFIFEISNREQKLLISSQTSQTKDDRMEKLLKKAKIFLDQKQRPKARIASLWSFTGMFSFKI
jgi:hypothetical protein